MISAVFITFRKIFDPHKLRLHLTPKAFFFDAFQKLPSGNTGPTHTVTHTTNCAERAKEHRRGNRFLSGALLACGSYRICAMKLPIFSAASCCIKMLCYQCFSFSLCIKCEKARPVGRALSLSLAVNPKEKIADPAADGCRADNQKCCLHKIPHFSQLRRAMSFTVSIPGRCFLSSSNRARASRRCLPV